MIVTDDVGLRRLKIADFLPSQLLAKPKGRKLLNTIVRREGGQMRSMTLRRVLSEQFDIIVEPHSYGSLLELGMCDPHTVIGAYCSIGKNVRRYGAAHPIDAPSTHPYFYNPALGLVTGASDVKRSRLEICADVWIGSNVTILPGCSYIGFGAVVGAGAVVTRDVDDFAIVTGNPAKVIKYRHSEELRARIKRSLFWTLAPDQALDEVLRLSAGKSEPPADYQS